MKGRSLDKSVRMEQGRMSEGEENHGKGDR